MTPNFTKSPDNLLPAIIQNATTGKVLMLGYMNEEAFEKTKKEGKVTFFSRSKSRLWTKGETSENYLTVRSISIDCDSDTLLIQAIPNGPTCHEGTETCFKDASAKGFLHHLEAIIQDRKNNPDESSYTSALFNKGTKKIAQKVGEEATEVILEAMAGERALLIEESSDLMYHWLVLLVDQGVSLSDIEEKLSERHK
jgi:phosphoribosyl-ATP pyrophosphohydrolase/phosphoribosyl-AMP cyclohydrolase